MLIVFNQKSLFSRGLVMNVSVEDGVPIISVKDTETKIIEDFAIASAHEIPAKGDNVRFIKTNSLFQSHNGDCFIINKVCVTNGDVTPIGLRKSAQTMPVTALH